MPLIVLSSNDGCAVARSNEAKALGIKMGEPLHELKRRFCMVDGTTMKPLTDSSLPRVVAFSANFELYGDISRRVAAVLARITPKLELYSIDEAFLDISKLNIRGYERWGRQLAAKIEREVGVPVSVGIAPTKTLCKLAADHVKHHPECEGAYYARNSREESLEATPIHNIWGIGWRLAPRLHAEGIHTAADLAAMRPKHAQQLMGILGRRTVAELNGLSCIPLSSTHKPQQVISRGRQFGHDTSDFATISAAVARMTNHACHALRKEGRLATRATIWLMTNRKKPNPTTAHHDIRLSTPIADTGNISHQLLTVLQQEFDAHHEWHKAEVTLWGLVPATELQMDVFNTIQHRLYAHSSTLMTTLDSINHIYGKGTLRYAAEDLSSAWYPRRAMQSPGYTSSWDDLPAVAASTW